ncbi:RNA polymerase sigma-70 factor [Dysgonomonas hofstadii]|uniref:RNA polymerase sigma-70 factor n=1 Tax=Dysgonomonas hofstadii TaxID=637886 RepID=UPI00160E0769|nr:RNA polymerase sigma-70 factor [Dysgonomonas hofstadii]
MSFSEIYISYYSKLLRFAREYVVVNEDAENIIQDVFVKLWERQDSLHLIDNINAYLFRLVRNKCLDYLRHKLSTEKCNKSVQNTFEMELNLKIQSLDRFDETFVSEKNMEKIVSDAIDSLPNKCREIFLSSRIEGLKYREISERFNISVNTVENQMSIALKKLRIKLKDHLSV